MNWSDRLAQRLGLGTHSIVLACAWITAYEAGPALDRQPERLACKRASSVENYAVFWRRADVVLHAILVDEECLAKIGPNLGEQCATARERVRHYIRRRHDVQATRMDLVAVSNSDYLLGQ
jgi:hypothetical protein